MSSTRDERPSSRTGPLTWRPVAPTIRAGCPPARSAGRLGLWNHPYRSSAEKQRLDDLRARPADGSASRKALLAERVLARESQHEPRRWAVDRRHHRFEPSHFLRHPAPSARLRVPGRESAAIGLLHRGLTEEVITRRARTGPQTRVIPARFRPVTQSARGCMRTTERSSRASRSAKLTFVFTTSRISV